MKDQGTKRNHHFDKTYLDGERRDTVSTGVLDEGTTGLVLSFLFKSCSSQELSATPMSWSFSTQR